MSKIKNASYLFIGLLIISASANLFAWEKIRNSKNIMESKEVKTQGLKLIENEYTKNLGELPDQWSVYSNEKYNFKINHPEEFQDKKIKIQEIDFNEDMDFYAKQNENKISDDAYFTFGSFKTARHIIDFNVFEKEEIWDNKTYQIESSLFAIVVHFNKFNLSFEDFISQEILNMPEGIEEQRIIKINGVEGYRVVLPRAIISAPIGVVYYIPSKDNKTIISIGAPIEIFVKIHYDKVHEFIEAYPQYKKEVDRINNDPTIVSIDEFLENNSDFKKFLKYLDSENAKLDLEYAKKELNKRLIFEKIVYSFQFN